MIERDAVRSYLRRYCDRRSFMKAGAALGIGMAGSGVLESVFDIVRTRLGPLRVSQTREAMGTCVTMTVLDDSRDRAEQAIGLGFEEIDRLAGVFSRYDAATPLSVWNRDGKLSDAPPDLIMLVTRAVEVWRMSGGAFDVTVQPLVDLFRERGDVDIPQREIDDALARTGSHKIQITGSTLRFRGEGMGVTLDGIAKGYIVDRVSRKLAESGAERHLINAGGDIRTSSGSSDAVTWRIAVQDPQKKGHYPDVIRMRNGAVATSGSYEVYYDRDRIHHHVVDPRLGISPHHSTSVSVVAPDVMMADALSTAVFVMSKDAGFRMIDPLAGCSCLVVDPAGQSYTTSDWKSAG
jgi:thiamine biosynthesis lipoprotein